MKRPLLASLTFFICLAPFVQAQQHAIDSIRQVIKQYETRENFSADTGYISAFNELAFRYIYINPDTALTLSRKVQLLAGQSGYTKGEAEALKNMGLAHNVLGNYDSALLLYGNALQISTDNGLTSTAGKILHNMGNAYSSLGKYPEALEHYFKALKLREQLNEKLGIASSLIGIGAVYVYQGKWDLALQYNRQGLDIAREINYKGGMEISSANIGEIYYRQKKYDEAREALMQSLDIVRETGNSETRAFIHYILGSISGEQKKYAEAAASFRQSEQSAIEVGSKEYQARCLIGLAGIFLATEKTDSAMLYARQGLGIAEKIRYNEIIRDGNEVLSRIYEQSGNGFLALAHYKRYKAFADSINNLQSEQRSGALLADYEFAKKELLLKTAFDRKQVRLNWIIFSAFAALFTAIIVGWLIYRSRQKEKNANALLQKQRDEINAQRGDLEQTLDKLKATQSHLVQSEKMASLGELTAGIAHEIQNPLNFVNNFSEINAELSDEILDAAAKGDLEEIRTLATDIKSNQEKINEHGKRADAIVKSMLLHSRMGTGQKEPTDINALAEEYLRLAFHGMRAKDKSFNTAILSEFDPAVGNIDVVPQEIGRVLLNLVNNAFYATDKKAKRLANGFAPEVKLSTRRLGDRVEIRVKDNGDGIPEQIRNKIFQPFFTTKPTGEGTGLGLSLSYDIIKAHGGELKLNTKESEGSEFLIELRTN